MKDKMETNYKEYLSIKIAGHNTINAFKNNDRTGNQPHFKGDGVAVWINSSKKEEIEQIEGVEINE